jgi:hypothetical protein
VLLSAIGIPMAWRTAIAYLRDPVAGMAENHHLLASLPSVMTGRYLAIALMVTGATLYRDLIVIAFLGACVALMAFWDSALYMRGGHPYRSHLVAGVLATIVSAFALFAHLMNGAAS